MGCKNSVEKYLDSLPSDIKIIDVSKKNLNYLPDLSRFKKLEILICYYNNLTSLPNLPENLKELHCFFNNLTSLPNLPENLKKLHCHYNNLTSLPVLPKNLEILYCHYNNLISLPVLPEKLKDLHFFKNPISEIIVYNYDYNVLNKKIKILNNFRHLYYCLKYRKIFLRIMEPIIKKRYHPSYLYNLKEEDDLDKKLGAW